MPEKCIYGFGTDIPLPFEEAHAKTEELLTRHKFNIYTRLNLQEIMPDSFKEELGRYAILGACNPEIAKILFSADKNIGLLMPCNVIVYELDSERCRVMIQDPARIMDLVSNPVAIQAAIDVKEEMEQVVEELKKIKPG